MTIEKTAAGIVAGMPVDMSWFGMGILNVESVEIGSQFTGFRFEGDPSLYSMYTSTGFRQCGTCAVWVPENTESMHGCPKPRCRVMDYNPAFSTTRDTTRISIVRGKSNHTGTYRSHVVEQIWSQLNSDSNELYIPIRHKG